MRILVLTTEPLPLPGLPTTGAGMRAWGLCFGLRSAGFDDVEIAFAADSIRGHEGALPDVPGVHTFERSKLGEFVESRNPDAIVLQHWGLANVLPEVRCPLAIDLAGPHLLERRLWGSKDTQKDLSEKLQALSRADYVVCSGQFQRHYFLPFLFQAGFDAAVENLCPVIPFSVSPDIPSIPKDKDASTFLFSGFFLPWQDPSDSLRWTLESLDAREKGKLVLVGGAHPGGDVSGGKYDRLLEKLNAHPRVERHGVKPFDELLSLVRRCGTAIDLMPRNAERELAFPTRTVVMMWAGVPVIHNNYDELAEPIERTKAGWTLDPHDEKGFKKVVERLVGHSEDVMRRAENAQKLVRDQYTWDRTIEPLASWCRNPSRRANKRAPSIPSAELEPRRKQRAAAGPDPRERISYSPPPPVAGPNRLAQVLSPVALLMALPIGLALLLLFGFAELVKLILRRR